MTKKSDQIQENKMWIVFGVAMGLFIAAYVAARGKFIMQLPILALLLIVAVAWPSFAAIIKIKGRKAGGIILGVLGLYSLLVATIALHTKFPFSRMHYTGLLGDYWYKVPWLVIIGYPTVFLLVYWLARFTTKDKLVSGRKSLVGNYAKIGAKGAVFMVLMATVIDVGASRVNYWHWDKDIRYLFYKVPAVDFVGWFFVGLVGTLLLHYLYTRDQKKPPPAEIALSGLASLWFWTSVNNWSGNLLPGIIGLVLTYLFGYYILIMRPKSK